jgi:hypothetical protein
MEQEFDLNQSIFVLYPSLSLLIFPFFGSSSLFLLSFSSLCVLLLHVFPSLLLQEVCSIGKKHISVRQFPQENANLLLLKSYP